MDKYQRALLELARTRKALEEANRRIAQELAASHQIAEDALPKDWNGWPIFPDWWDETWMKKNLHLTNAYARYATQYEDGYVNHDDDVRGYLAEHCVHALHAHDLIQARKELRKDLGIAKRRVTFLANKLLRSMEVSNG